MFVDEVKLMVIAGKGGDGALAFRREKYVPMGGPYGGNGGRGGNIHFVADEGLSTLIDLQYQKQIKADSGENGLGKNQYGSDAKDIYIKVPVGTVVTDLKTNKVICDLDKNGQDFIVAYGGRGGRGNTAFKTHANPAPNFAEKGEMGETKELKVELKLLADVGLVGLPSVGKSTIISKVSAAKPKIADYPFTTLIPNLGVVRTQDGRSFVLTDLPGLIEGAALGKGLGDRFLKHIERCKIIAHVLDMSDSNVIDNYELINKELKAYSDILAQKKQIVVANKMDSIDANINLENFKKVFKGEIFEISAIKGEGLIPLMMKLKDLVDLVIEEEKTKITTEDIDHIVYQLDEEDRGLQIRRENDIWILSGKDLEKLYRMTNFNTYEANKRFMYKLKKMGLEETLIKAGVQPLDKVKIYDLEFIYEE